MKISITAEHIKNGKRKDACNCPIALAFKSLGWEKATVGPSIISLLKTNCAKHLKHSHQSTIFMHHFDQGLTVIPQELEILE